MRTLTRKTAPNARARIDRRPWLRNAMIALGVVGLAGLGLAGFRFGPGAVQTAHSLSDQAWRGGATALGLTLESVVVTGRDRTDRAAIMAAIGITAGAPILDADPALIRERLEALDWIDHARVKRAWPNRLEIALSESVPVARWQVDGRISLIDARGRRITDNRVENFTQLPLLVGEGANAQAREALSLLAAAPTLRARVQAMIRVGGRRWNMRFDNDVDLLLPEEEASAALRKFVGLEAERGLLGRAITQVDMRLKEKVVVRLTDEGQKILRTPGKST